MKQKSTSSLNRKGPNMKAIKIGAIQYRSASAAAVAIANRSPKATLQSIADRVGVKVPTVKQALDNHFNKLLKG